MAELIKRYPIKSRNVIAHIRKATQGALELENCHPFIREHWGRHWLFAHNGDLKAFAPALRGDYLPIGQTDSEQAFCCMMEGLRARFGAHEPDDARLFEAVAEMTEELASYGVFNFLLSNGHCLLAHCSTHLYYITRAWPFHAAHLIDADMTVDFSRTHGRADCVFGHHNPAADRQRNCDAVPGGRAHDVRRRRAPPAAADHHPGRRAAQQLAKSGLCLIHAAPTCPPSKTTRVPPNL
ncbi:hypothetical protein CDEF62S_04432 [Castellaniella defragrans]